ncbi:predicted protein [Plenodomus lingam JN3]|uniref:Predicted protein n=1 Tax=Leptosphaeria maculans (strain JN3 / isolate v23.1.3 / race Av1-4-5-6-7-8) TaxID=985895 RepID=E5ACD3_LEPMJ|nr:predicted protein [Plenodomus lingam JN3]CBY02135.1 predicted protein [Plenodomus lingam JN3]
MLHWDQTLMRRKGDYLKIRANVITMKRTTTLTAFIAMCIAAPTTNRVFKPQPNVALVADASRVQDDPTLEGEKDKLCIRNGG